MGYQSRRVGLSLFCQCLYILYSLNLGPGGNQSSDNHRASVNILETARDNHWEQIILANEEVSRKGIKIKLVCLSVYVYYWFGSFIGWMNKWSFLKRKQKENLLSTKWLSSVLWVTLGSPNKKSHFQYFTHLGVKLILKLRHFRGHLNRVDQK